MTDLVVVPELSFFEKLALGYAVLRNNVEKFKKAKHTLVKNLTIEIPDKIYIYAQVDGEYHNLKSNTLQVSIINKGLKVLTE